MLSEASPTSTSPTSTKRMSAVINSHAEITIPDAYRSGNGSPPRTPQRRRKDRKDPPSSYPKSARLAAATGTPSFDGYDPDCPTDDDGEDPHDLTYSTKHFPRASMVDNMLMALDQFSHPNTGSPHYDQDLRGGYRGRGHTFSSSLSSESDVRALQAHTLQPHGQRLARRSSARYTRDPTKLPSIFGEDEDSARVRLYDSQRAAHPIKSRKQPSVNEHNLPANITSADVLPHLKHLQQARLGPAGNRRSQSFDFTTRRQFEEDDTTDIAPHPVIYSGPEAQKAPGSPSRPPQPMGRRGSFKSSKNVRIKSSTIAPSVVRGMTAPPVLHSTPAAASGPKTPLSQITEQSNAPHPGFFKRLFASSRSLATATAPPATPVTRRSLENVKDATNTSTTYRLQRPPHKDSVDIRDKENVQPTLTKKPSSFFRRRKKSVSTAIVPPLPLTLGSLAASDVNPGEQSPVSSLKAFMDPYLTDDNPQKGPQTPTNPLRGATPLHSFHVPIELADTDRSRTESPEPIRPRRKDMSKLDVPQKETFLTDTSSCDEGEHSATSDIDQTEPRRSTQQSTPRPMPRAASTTPALSTIRPVVEARSSSWHSDRLGLPVQKDPLVVVETKRTTSPMPKPIVTSHHRHTSSGVSEYKSAPDTPTVFNPEHTINDSPRLHVSHPSVSGEAPIFADIGKAQHIYNNGEEELEGQTAAAWLGEAGSERERVRKAYMVLFDWTGYNILAALRGLCSRLVLRAESQLIDRILDAFAKRWCACNPGHGFKSSDVVHTICYSLLLLNTDLHMADIGSKMTRNQFVKNAMQTIRPVVADASDISNFAAGPHLTVRSGSTVSGSDGVSLDDEPIRVGSSLGHRPTEQLIRATSNGMGSDSVHGPLVDVAFSGSQAGWEGQIEAVLKDFYHSIQREPLPLFGSDMRYASSNGNSNLLSLGGLRRSPSVLSKAQSESNRSRFGESSRSLGSKWNSKGRSRPRLGTASGFGSSKNSLDDQSSAWSPSMSSTWSKASLGKTLTSMSVDSFATSNPASNDYNASIGFANALSQAIIREDQLETQTDDSSMKAAPLLEDESLELEGAPWAKEGILKHKCHLEGMDKKSKDRTWNDCFAVVEKGWMRLFSFSVTAKSMRNRARSQKPNGAVGGGNWQDNAEEVWKFMLRHTIASSLPPPGYSKARPHVWALSLPTGAVHLFSAGTADIVKEFVSTANFWSARLSKEPMIGGVSSMEYGWGDNVINRALTGPEVRGSLTGLENGMPRASTQVSIRNSIDHSNQASRPKLPGDKVHISVWSPPQRSLMASQLMEVDQLRALQTYVANIEEELQKHNELRGAMLLAFSSRQANYGKAMANWEKKSAYLLREIVKFKNYIDALQGAQVSKERVMKIRREQEQQRQDLDDSNAFYGSATMVS